MLISARIKYIIPAILFIMASVNFTRTAFKIIENSKRLDDLSVEVVELEQEKKTLGADISFKETENYVEEKARNELSMVKPGEKVYVLKDTNLFENTTGIKEQKVLGAFSDSDSNIIAWLRLFF